MRELRSCEEESGMMVECEEVDGVGGGGVGGGEGNAGDA